jgi:hypothetical protein
VSHEALHLHSRRQLTSFASVRLTIGDVDGDLFEGELNWMPSSQTYWQIELQAMSVMGTVLDVSAEQVTVDT